MMERWEGGSSEFVSDIWSSHGGEFGPGYGTDNFQSQLIFNKVQGE